jgi:uncharacterized membrane protein
VAAGAELKPRGGGPAANWRRLNGPARFAGIDLARGLAVVGMLAAHLLATDDLVWSDPATWTGIVDGRSSILFATLAGVSIGLVTGGRTPVRGQALGQTALRIAVRALAIWVLGVLLIATGVPVYVILPAYAILFLLVLPLLTLRPAVLFAVAGGIGLIMPWVYAALMQAPLWAVPGVDEVSLLVGWQYPFPVWAAFVVAGLGIGRLDLRALGTQAGLLLFGSGFAAVGYGLAAGTAADGGGAAVQAPASTSLVGAVWTAEPHSSGVLEVFGSGGFAIAVLGACLLLCRPWWPGATIGPIGWVGLPLRATGAMPLTAYTAQIVVWAIVAAVVLGDPSDLLGFRALEPFMPFALWTIAACTAWALLIGRGPLEGLIDRLSRRVGARATRGADPSAAARIG